MWNNLSAEEIPFTGSLTSPQWLTAYSWKTVIFYENGELLSLPFQCMHCRDPPCALAFPVPAIVISDEGAVVINKDDCLGIGNCLRACPFNVPQRGSDGRFYKCTFCIDRIQYGLEPACVEVCPTKVFTFASIDEVINIARRAVEEGKHVYGIDLDDYIGRGTRWIYIASKRKYGVIKKFFPKEARKDLDLHTTFFVNLKRKLRIIAIISMLNRAIRKGLKAISIIIHNILRSKYLHFL